LRRSDHPGSATGNLSTMKLLILGATGPTGRQLVKQAVERSHTVSAAVRNPFKLAGQDRHLSVNIIDVLNEDQLTGAIRGNDAVLSALGSGRDLHSTIISRTTPVLIRAMENAAVKRLIFLSSFGVGDSWHQASFLSKFFFRLLLKDILADKGKADQLLRNSGLDYTLVYPTSLHNGKRSGKYETGENISPGLFPRISRADVAEFMLQQVDDPKWIRKTVIISN
jgi:putative NADH-flavin reductase